MVAMATVIKVAVYCARARYFPVNVGLLSYNPNLQFCNPLLINLRIIESELKPTSLVINSVCSRRLDMGPARNQYT